MLIENTTDTLRDFGRKLFALVQDLTGSQPQLLPSGDYYRAEVEGRPFLYLRFIGEGGRRYPPNSVHLSAPWSEDLAGEGVEAGNNWYGSGPSADVSARPNHPVEVAIAVSFVCRAFLARINRERIPE